MPLKATERDVYEFFSKAGKVGFLDLFSVVNKLDGGFITLMWVFLCNCGS